MVICTLIKRCCWITIIKFEIAKIKWLIIWSSSIWIIFIFNIKLNYSRTRSFILKVYFKCLVNYISVCTTLCNSFWSNPINACDYWCYLVKNNCVWFCACILKSYKVCKVCFYSLTSLCNWSDIYVCKFEGVCFCKYFCEFYRFVITCNFVVCILCKQIAVYRNCCVFCKFCIIWKVNYFYTTTIMINFCSKIKKKSYFLAVCIFIVIAKVEWVCRSVINWVFNFEICNFRLFWISIDVCAEWTVWIVNFVFAASRVCYKVFYCKANFVSFCCIDIYKLNILECKFFWSSFEFRRIIIKQGDCVICSIEYIICTFWKSFFSNFKFCGICKFYLIRKFNNLKSWTIFIYIDFERNFCKFFICIKVSLIRHPPLFFVCWIVINTTLFSILNFNFLNNRNSCIDYNFFIIFCIWSIIVPVSVFCLVEQSNLDIVLTFCTIFFKLKVLKIKGSWFCNTIFI